MKIIIIDYGAGNLRSVQKAFQFAASELNMDADINISGRPEDILNASKVVLPGVGAFLDCKEAILRIDKMMNFLHEVIIVKGIPFMGICIGMHLLATKGYENGINSGFDWISGDVVPLENIKEPVPHMGWNELLIENEHPIVKNIKSGDHCYFVHSYIFSECNKSNIIASSDYNGLIPSIIAKNNIIGTQFHPEKSQTIGIQIIKNFLKWCP